jgi:phosphatidate phosphatase PAH1
MLHHCHAYDLLVVQQPDGSLSASQALVYFGHNMRSEIDFFKFELALVLVRDAQAFCHPFGTDQRFDDATLCAVGTKLQPGRNAARMLLTDRATHDIRGLAPMNVFLWRSHDPVAVVDVDGTITKSSLSGFWHTAVRQDFHGRHCHSGVCPFVNALAASASLSQQQEQEDDATRTMNVLYLTNRPITYASETRDFLTSVRQQETSLPPGLLVGFLGTITGVLKVRRHFYVCWWCPGGTAMDVSHTHIVIDGLL